MQGTSAETRTAPLRTWRAEVRVVYAIPTGAENDRVAEAPVREFVVTCKNCGRDVMTVERLRDPEVDRLQAHLRACVRPDPLGKAPMLGEVLIYVSVAKS